MLATGLALGLVSCGDTGSGTGGNPGGAPEGGAGPGEVGGGGSGALGGGGAGTGAAMVGGSEIGGAGGAPSGPCAETENLQPAPDQFQTVGDCRVMLCVDDELQLSGDDSDVPVDDGVECTSELCIGGAPVVTIETGSQCGVDGVCNDAADCVECLTAAECTGNPAGEVCDAGVCVECASPSDCAPSLDVCGAATCVANVCGDGPAAPGVTPASCFPYACDGVSSDCPLSCVTDADCAGQTCNGGVCQASSACDLEWVNAVSDLCDPGILGGTLNAVHLDGQISLSAFDYSWNQSFAVRRFAPDGTPTGQWFANNSLADELCYLTFGPLGGWGSNCQSFDNGFGEALFRNHEYGWTTGFSASGLSGISGGGSIDGANTVRFSGVAMDLDPLTPPIFYNSTRTIEGATLPASTPTVPTGPSQTLPAGFAATILSQLASSDTRVDADGTIAVTGTSAGSVDFGTGPMPPIDATDVIIARFDPQGAPLWARRYPAAGAVPTVVENPWIAGDGSVIAIGEFTSADFGLGPMTPQAAGARFLVKLDANGDPVCAHSIVADKAIRGPSGEVVFAKAGGPMVVDDATIGSGPYVCSPGGTVTWLTVGRFAP